MNPKIYILLPVHNRKEITLKFINSLLKQSYTNYQLLLIDDGSTDGTSIEVKTLIPNTIIIKGYGNWWWAGSLQQGFNWIKNNNINKKEIVLIVNDDTILEKDFLSNGTNYLKQNSNTLLLAYAYDLANNQLLDCGINYDFKKNIISKPSGDKKINCLSTRGLFLYVEDFQKIGGFYPNLLPHYGSDYEFTARAFRKGYTLSSSNDVKLFFNKETTGIHVLNEKKFYNYFKLFFSKRNLMHPIYRINFYLLTFPFPYNLKYSFFHFINSLISILIFFTNKKNLN